MKAVMVIRWILIFIILSPIANALECYQCDSAEDSECATRPGQQIEVEECLKDDDQCVTVIVAGHTRRGCLSRLFPNKYCPEPCQRCNTNLCNRNVFPHDRLRCFQCFGSNCVKVDNKTELILPCPIYKENDRCYTNIIQESNVQRGCEHTNLPNICPNICLKCNYNGCNKEPGSYEDSCLQCTHTPMRPNPYCLRDINPVLPGGSCTIIASSTPELNVKTCTNKMVFGHKTKCFTYVNHQTQFIERGCSTHKPFYPTGNLTECYGKNCNNECLPIACNACNATSVTDNIQCRQGQNLRSEFCDSDTFFCYACESPYALRRGCTNTSFVPSKNEACYHCSTADGCNSKIPLRTCYHCSSRDDESCASATFGENRKWQKLCSSETELCVSTIVNKFNIAFVVRGCASTVPDCHEFDPYCIQCNGSLCNNVPIEWRQSFIAAYKHSFDLVERSNACGLNSISREEMLLVFLIYVLCFM